MGSGAGPSPREKRRWAAGWRLHEEGTGLGCRTGTLGCRKIYGRVVEGRRLIPLDAQPALPFPGEQTLLRH